MPWTAQQWREHRRLKGVRPKNDEETELPERIYQSGKELQAMWMAPVKDLNWPRFLFRDYTLAVNGDGKLFDGKKKTDDHLCRCGCCRPHNHAVSRVVEETNYGFTSRYVAWYASIQCKNKHMGLVK